MVNWEPPAQCWRINDRKLAKGNARLRKSAAAAVGVRRVGRFPVARLLTRRCHCPSWPPPRPPQEAPPSLRSPPLGGNTATTSRVVRSPRHPLRLQTAYAYMISCASLEGVFVGVSGRPVTKTTTVVVLCPGALSFGGPASRPLRTPSDYGGSCWRPLLGSAGSSHSMGALCGGHSAAAQHVFRGYPSVCHRPSSSSPHPSLHHRTGA